MALRQEDLPITDIIAQTPDIPEIWQWRLFLRSHDELALEMVTNDERDYMYLAYSADPRMRVLCVAHLSRFDQPVDLDLSQAAGATPVEMLGYREFPQLSAPYRITLTPYSFLWFELQQRAQPAR
jgi:hypothetical protein